MSCICFRMWTEKDDEADQDIRRGSLTAALKSTDIKGSPAPPAAVDESKTVTVDEATEKDDIVTIVVSEDSVEPTPEVAQPSEKEIPIEAQVVAAPTSGDAIASAEGESMSAAGGLLTDGGLLLTEVTGRDKVVRRLFVDGEKGTLSWEIERVFGKGEETVILKDCRVMRTGNLVKIGVAGRKRFYTFEACDDAEAVAIVDSLTDHVRGTEKTTSEESEAEAPEKNAS